MVSTSTFQNGLEWLPLLRLAYYLAGVIVPHPVSDSRQWHLDTHVVIFLPSLGTNPEIISNKLVGQPHVGLSSGHVVIMTRPHALSFCRFSQDDV